MYMYFRNSGVAAGQFAGRLGALLAPQIVYLVSCHNLYFGANHSVNTRRGGEGGRRGGRGPEPMPTLIY